MSYLSPVNNSSLLTDMQNLSEQQNYFPSKDPFIQRGKTSFLVFKNQKYRTIATDTIAYFYLKFEGVRLVCFDRQEYSVNYSLEQIQHMLPEAQFYRLNRQYLVHFGAVKEVEHYFARKLLVTLNVPAADKLPVSKEKANHFLHWLENR